MRALQPLMVPRMAPGSRRISAAQLLIDKEVATARADLPADLSETHPGRPERLSHPAFDAARIAGGAATEGPGPSGPLPGLDVSSFQGNVDWSTVSADGAKFAYVKATEGTYYTNPSFDQQYEGSASEGLVRGAYQFAIPDNSTGAAQADFFVAHGGAWVDDNHTLPGMVDLEYNPYGPVCYGLSPAQMVGWIADFVGRYHQDTGRWPVIYTTAGWWATCTAGSTAFAGNDPLFIAHYGSTPGPLAAGWKFYTFWQRADHGIYPGDQDVFNGAEARLIALADDTGTSPLAGAGVPVTGVIDQLLATLEAAVSLKS